MLQRCCRGPPYEAAAAVSCFILSFAPETRTAVLPMVLLGPHCPGIRPGNKWRGLNQRAIICAVNQCRGRLRILMRSRRQHGPAARAYRVSGSPVLPSSSTRSGAARAACCATAARYTRRTLSRSRSGPDPSRDTGHQQDCLHVHVDVVHILYGFIALRERTRRARTYIYNPADSVQLLQPCVRAPLMRASTSPAPAAHPRPPLRPRPPQTCVHHSMAGYTSVYCPSSSRTARTSGSRASSSGLRAPACQTAKLTRTRESLSCPPRRQSLGSSLAVRRAPRRLADGTRSSLVLSQGADCPSAPACLQQPSASSSAQRRGRASVAPAIHATTRPRCCEPLECRPWQGAHPLVHVHRCAEGGSRCSSDAAVRLGSDLEATGNPRACAPGTCVCWRLRGGGEGGGSSNPEKGGSGRGEDVPVVGEEGCPHQLGHLPHRSPSEALCVTRQPPCKAPALWAGSQSAGSTPGAQRIRPSARETSRTAGGKARKLPHICAARPHGVVRRVRGGGAPRGGTCGGRSPRGSPSCSDREQGVRMSGACRPLSPLDSSHRREDQETFPIVCPVISTDIANSLSLPPSPFTSLSLPPLSPPLPPPSFFSRIYTALLRCRIAICTLSSVASITWRQTCILQRVR